MAKPFGAKGPYAVEGTTVGSAMRVHCAASTDMSACDLKEAVLLSCVGQCSICNGDLCDIVVGTHMESASIKVLGTVGLMDHALVAILENSHRCSVKGPGICFTTDHCLVESTDKNKYRLRHQNHHEDCDSTPASLAFV